MNPTSAPWAKETSHFPQLVRPQTDGTLEPQSSTADRMNLTSAPWANSSLPEAPAAPTRSIVEPLISAAPQMPAAVTSPAEGYQPARKKIHSEADVKRFLASDAIKDFVSFILSLNEAVKGKKLSDPCTISPIVSGLLDAINTLSTWVDQIPPVQQSLRYGNPAYRVWFAKMQQEAPGMMSAILPEASRAAAAEIVPYWCDSFGNHTRIDYGTGHETTFCALLYCLARLGAVQQEDQQPLVTKVFAAYLDLMRKVQTTYWLEPAGSHGVWGLDDYQFLPFIWGSSQLQGHPMIKPKSIHNPDVLEGYSGEYMYLGCVSFVKQVKKGPLAETSPIINDVSSVPTWAKVNSGMVKMYQVEVLSKFPIMQHFLFGSLLAFD